MVRVMLSNGTSVELEMPIVEIKRAIEATTQSDPLIELIDGRWFNANHIVEVAIVEAVWEAPEGG